MNEQEFVAFWEGVKKDIEVGTDVNFKDDKSLARYFYEIGSCDGYIEGWLECIELLGGPEHNQ